MSQTPPEHRPDERVQLHLHFDPPQASYQVTVRRHQFDVAPVQFNLSFEMILALAGQVLTWRAAMLASMNGGQMPNGPSAPAAGDSDSTPAAIPTKPTLVES